MKIAKNINRLQIKFSVFVCKYSSTSKPIPLIFLINVVMPVSTFANSPFSMLNQGNLSSASTLARYIYEEKITVISLDKHKSCSSEVFHQEKGKAALKKIRQKDEPVQAVCKVF